MNIGDQEKLKRKQELPSCSHPQFNGMHTIHSISHNSVRKYKPVYNFYFSIDPRSTFIGHYSDDGRNAKHNPAYQYHYDDCFFRYWKKFNKDIKRCSGHPGFVYTFQDENLECYKNYIKHKKYFPFTVVGDLETTTGYISEIKGGSMFATSHCLMFNFHPKLKMMPITCLRSFGQNEEELENITIPEKFRLYINTGDLTLSTLCMIEMWMVHRCLKYCFDAVVKINNYQLTQEEKEDFQIFADFNPQNKKVSHCYFCKFLLKCKVLNLPEKPTRECSRLDFVIRKEYQFVKNIFFQKQISESKHLNSINSYDKALTFLSKAYEFLAMQANHSVMIDEKILNAEYKKFVTEYMPECSTYKQIQKEIKDCKILGGKKPTLKQKAFTLI